MFHFHSILQHQGTSPRVPVASNLKDTSHEESLLCYAESKREQGSAGRIWRVPCCSALTILSTPRLEHRQPTWPVSMKGQHLSVRRGKISV